MQYNTLIFVEWHYSARRFKDVYTELILRRQWCIHLCPCVKAKGGYLGSVADRRGKGWGDRPPPPPDDQNSWFFY